MAGLLSLCIYLTNQFWFWMAVVLFTIGEPFLCAWNDPIMFMVQWLVLSINSGLFAVQFLSEIGTSWKDMKKVTPAEQVKKSSFIFLFRGEFLVELICIGVGWSFIFIRVGVAILRCFRVFRLLWLYDIKVFREPVVKFFDPYIGAQAVNQWFLVFKFGLNSLTALGNELIGFTAKTRGGLFLLLLVFFMSYVIGAVVFTEVGGQHPACETLPKCCYTIFRLALFDGEGLDFAYTLTDGNNLLFLITMTYMCVAAFGLLNGMVGIFGSIFAQSSDETFSIQPSPSIDLDLEQGYTPSPNMKMRRMNSIKDNFLRRSDSVSVIGDDNSNREETSPWVKPNHSQFHESSEKKKQKNDHTQIGPLWKKKPIEKKKKSVLLGVMSSLSSSLSGRFANGAVNSRIMEENFKQTERLNHLEEEVRDMVSLQNQILQQQQQILNILLKNNKTSPSTIQPVRNGSIILFAESEDVSGSDDLET